MAGFIDISRDAGCSMGSHDFRLLVGAARTALMADDADAATDLYEYFEESGQCLLVLVDKDERVFNAFCRAIDSALKDPEVEKHLTLRSRQSYSRS